MYLFTSKDRRKAKVFFFDGTGVCIYMKRLCRGRSAELRRAGDELCMTMSELALYLEGSELVGRRVLSPSGPERGRPCAVRARVIRSVRVAARTSKSGGQVRFERVLELGGNALYYVNSRP